jgi:hypothetical protein
VEGGGEAKDAATGKLLLVLVGFGFGPSSHPAGARVAAAVWFSTGSGLSDADG